jgi:quercetin dioxygenase-like cupin family protein
MNGKLEFYFYKSYLRDTYVEFHQHNCYELVYYAKGSGKMKLNGETLNYVPNSM